MSLADFILEDAKKVVDRIDLSPLQGKWVSVAGATGIIGTYVLAVLKVYGQCGAIRPIATRFPEKGHPAAVMFPNQWAWTKTDCAHMASHAIIPPADYIFYGVGYGQPAKFMAKPLDTIAMNTDGLMNALKSVLPNGRLLYVSSSEVYSGNPNPPYTETDYGTTMPQHPRACYIEAKRCGEAICSAFNQKETIRAVSARVALCYGPGTRPDDDRVINQFIKQALTTGEISMRDSGSAIRTYCYASDCVEQLFLIWLHGKKEVYNVGGNSRLTIHDLACRIGTYCNVPILSMQPAVAENKGAPKIVEMSLDRIMIEFPQLVRPNVSMQEGLVRTIEWQKELYGKV